jgi:hypothetical protein
MNATASPVAAKNTAILEVLPLGVIGDSFIGFPSNDARTEAYTLARFRVSDPL